jgi:hypothetical protein
LEGISVYPPVLSQAGISHGGPRQNRPPVTVPWRTSYRSTPGPEVVRNVSRN